MSQVQVYQSSSAIESDEGLPIRYDLYEPSTQRASLPVVLFLHGFKGFKEWGPFPSACEDLARLGFVVVAFNFSHNGIEENPERFDRLDLFEKQTLSRDLNDTGRIVEAISSGEISSGRTTIDAARIGIVGHSRGGHTAIAAAAEYTPVQVVVTWAAVADYNSRWSDEMIRDWDITGYTEILNSRTGQTMRVGREVYDDARESADRVIALNRVKELHLPILFMAGKEDEAVPWKDSQALYRACPSDNKEFRLIPSTGHTFGSAHPFESDDYPEPFADLLERTGEWLTDHLGE